MKRIRTVHASTLMIGVAIALVATVQVHAHSWDGKHWHDGHGKALTCQGPSGDPNDCLILLYNDDGLAPIYEAGLLDALTGWENTNVPYYQYHTPLSNSQVRLKSDNYGQNDWMGSAFLQPWWSQHPTVAFIEFNDYYIGSGGIHDEFIYRRRVACHELGHALGLDHSGPEDDSCLNTSTTPFPSQVGSHDYADVQDTYQ